jgi:hypothetical protein
LQRKFSWALGVECAPTWSWQKPKTAP